MGLLLAKEEPLFEGKSPIGQATMSSGLPNAQNYHRYLFNTLKPFLGNRVWEIGSGYGQYTKMLLEEKKSVLATDIDERFLEQLRTLTPEGGSKLDISFIDLCSAEAIGKCAAWKPDSLLCLNVLEHIEKDSECLQTLREALGREILSTGVTASFLVPAHQLLYGFMDKQAGHFRRYTRSSLEEAFKKAGWKVTQSFYLNSVGAAGWFIRNRVLPPKSKDIDDPVVNKDIAFFDTYCMPVAKVLDIFTSRFFGQSVVVIAKS